MQNEHPESEINRIRIELYDETKDLTPTERTRRSNEQGRKLAIQYGFKFVSSTNNVKGNVTR